VRISLPTSLTLLVAVCACGDAAAPTLTDVAGSYRATTFTTQDLGGATDWLAQGALLNLVLGADGGTTGRLFVPGADEGGGDFDADLAGTWLLHGDTVEFNHPADTFVRDMPFMFADNRLTGAGTFADTRLSLVLTKQ
jgi:hypothetical protein